ncbi:hypothetical protein WH47_00851 [Habropoda laboriosa]|uniref:Uncharacterized protein n=1 Tax=Habropoda laboriosa TaxID=597456 RepID=A0A0L7QK40_9HYME|nr:hypothetical protein WH47_00851 [Habropoda laboriosa]
MFFKERNKFESAIRKKAWLGWRKEADGKVPSRERPIGLSRSNPSYIGGFRVDKAAGYVGGKGLAPREGANSEGWGREMYICVGGCVCFTHGTGKARRRTTKEGRTLRASTSSETRIEVEMEREVVEK